MWLIKKIDCGITSDSQIEIYAIVTFAKDWFLIFRFFNNVKFRNIEIIELLTVEIKINIKVSGVLNL